MIWTLLIKCVIKCATHKIIEVIVVLKLLDYWYYWYRLFEPLPSFVYIETNTQRLNRMNHLLLWSDKSEEEHEKCKNNSWQKLVLISTIVEMFHSISLLQFQVVSVFQDICSCCDDWEVGSSRLCRTPDQPPPPPPGLSFANFPSLTLLAIEITIHWETRIHR